MKKVLKSALLVAVAAVMFWVVPGANVFAAEDQEAADFAELLVILDGLMADLQNLTLDERLARHEPFAGSGNVDERHALVVEFSFLAVEATIIQEAARGCELAALGFATRAPISGMSGPTALRNTFSIHFTSEIYYKGLIDLLVEFTGIERELINATTPVLRAACCVSNIEPSTVGQVYGNFDEQGNFIPYDEVAWEELMEQGRKNAERWRRYYLTCEDWCCEDSLERDDEGAGVQQFRGWPLPMGARLFVRERGVLVGMGTLGHPRTNTGRTALSTSHDRFLVGHMVYAPFDTGSVDVPIGIIRISEFHHSPPFQIVPALDFSLIQMMNSFTVSLNIPGGGMVNTTPVNVPNSQPVRMISGSPINGRVVYNPHDAWIRILHPIGYIRYLFHGVIATTIPAQAGNSGSALLSSGNGVAGTIFAMHREDHVFIRSYAIPAYRYWSLTSGWD